MALEFTIRGRVNRPLETVYEAVVNPADLSGYFTTGGAKGRIETGATVYWDFHDFPGAFPVTIIEAVKNDRIVLTWEATEKGEDGRPYDTKVTMTFEALEGGRTLVAITEEGWPETKGGQRSSYGNCEGWTQMLCAMKAYLEYDGINLRDGFYK